MTGPPDLDALVRDEMTQPVDPRVTAMAAAIAGRYPGAARAVLFYGSCLREDNLDGLMLDFYLIVSDYRAAYGKRWLAAANQTIPPNVFPFAHDGLVAKYAVLTEDDLAYQASMRAASVSVWARFAQPSRLVWTADDAVRAGVFASVAGASQTLFRLALPLLDDDDAPDTLTVWREGFARTYAAELRAERGTRAGSVVDADPDRYRRFTPAVMAALAKGDGTVLSRREAERRWRGLRRRGKALTLLRLAKASLTYAGGIDYLAWKVNRHAGTAIAITDWQRRHPILAAFTLLPRLLRQGAVR